MWTKEEIASALPLLPRTGMKEAVLDACNETLNRNFCLYKRVSSAEVDTGGIGWPDFDVPEEKTHWVAECRCGACGSVWHSAWISGGEGIFLAEGEDGITFPGIPFDGFYQECHEDDTFFCPFCEQHVQLIRAKNLKSGRTYRNLVGSVENVGPYTAVVAWMAERYVHSDGDSSFMLYPKAAAVIDVSGRLMFFRFDGSMWRPRSSTADPFQTFYYSWNGGLDRQVGAWLWPDVPEQMGQTGEKTGVADYFRSGGRWPVVYLNLWRKAPAIENLVKAGWLKPFEEIINDEVLSFLQRSLDQISFHGKKLSFPDGINCLADWGEVKPHKMLGMTREEIREGAKWKWDASALGLWLGCIMEGLASPGDAALFEKCRKRYGIGALQKWADMSVENRLPASLKKIDSYCFKQSQKRALPLSGALTMYLDYWEMLGAEYPEPVQIFPPDLRAAHDRAMASARIKSSAKFISGFRQTAEKWHELEWSDGHICTVLPRTNGDLEAEGKTLNHCVGGYGEDHVKGKLIVFIRHRRRPERSWFTLNIDTSGQSWKEIQLHGYGNEYAHGKWLRIPKEVRDFVDRWEKEVLSPVFRKVKISGAWAAKKGCESA